MTLTKLALQDVQHSADLKAAIEALLAGSQPQQFTPPKPEPQHLVVEYHHEAGYTTEDLIGAHIVASFSERR